MALLQVEVHFMTYPFEIGDYAVCPGHGVGQVTDIEKKEMGDEILEFYRVKIISNGMSIMVPVQSATGIRHLVSSDEAQKVFELLSDHAVDVDTSTWNRRHRDYMNKIKTGSIYEIAEVIRALFLLKTMKNLSFGEKKLLEQCREMVAEEISLSSGHKKTEVCGQIESCFSSQQIQQ